MIRFFLLFLIFIFISPLYGVEPPKFPNANSQSIGNAGINQNNLWSSLNYPHNLAHLENTYLGISFENKYSIKELNSFAIGLNIPVDKSGFGIALSQYGNTIYKENRLYLGYGKQLSEIISVGIGLNYYSFSQTQDDKLKSIYADIGFRIQIDDNLTLGVQVRNPALFSSNDTNLSENYQLGIQYILPENIILYLKSSYTSINKIQYHTGVEIRRRAFSIRMGYTSLSEQLSFGFGYQRNRLEFNFGTRLHQFLGYSPSITMNYEL